MAGYKSLGAVLLLAVAALLVAAARAVDDEHMYHWKCFKSCTGNCRDDDVVHSAGAWNVSAAVSGGGKCKDKCLNECFVEDLPAHCYHQCVVTNCLCFPPFSKERTTCLKSCCDKCFHPVPPKPPCPPKPKPPTPPAPQKPPSPSKPKPPAPTKPKPPAPPKPPTPKKPPPPKKPCPCPPGSDEIKADNKN